MGEVDQKQISAKRNKACTNNVHIAQDCTPQLHETIELISTVEWEFLFQ